MSFDDQGKVTFEPFLQTLRKREVTIPMRALLTMIVTTKNCSRAATEMPSKAVDQSPLMIIMPTLHTIESRYMYTFCVTGVRVSSSDFRDSVLDLMMVIGHRPGNDSVLFILIVLLFSLPNSADLSILVELPGGEP